LSIPNSHNSLQLNHVPLGFMPVVSGSKVELTKERFDGRRQATFLAGQIVQSGKETHAPDRTSIKRVARRNEIQVLAGTIHFSTGMTGRTTCEGCLASCMMRWRATTGFVANPMWSSPVLRFGRK
jgi:hypothetical protein